MQMIVVAAHQPAEPPDGHRHRDGRDQRVGHALGACVVGEPEQPARGRHTRGSTGPHGQRHREQAGEEPDAAADEATAHTERGPGRGGVVRGRARPDEDQRHEQDLPDDGAHGDRGDRGPQAQPEVHAQPAERDGAQADGAADEHHEEGAGCRGALGLRDAVDAVALDPRRRDAVLRGHFARRSLPLNAHGRVPLRRSSDDRGASSSPCAARRDLIGQTRKPIGSVVKPARHRNTAGNRRRHDRQPSCGVRSPIGGFTAPRSPQVRRRSRRRCRRSASTARRCAAAGSARRGW